MEKKKPKPSEMREEILSQCPECLALETSLGKDYRRTGSMPSVVRLKSVEERLCWKCVERFTI